MPRCGHVLLRPKMAPRDQPPAARRWEGAGEARREAQGETKAEREAQRAVWVGL